MQLHAREIGVPDRDGITIRIKAPIPEHMLNIFDAIKLPKNIIKKMSNSKEMMMF